MIYETGNSREKWIISVCSGSAVAFICNSTTGTTTSTDTITTDDT